MRNLPPTPPKLIKIRFKLALLAERYCMFNRVAAGQVKGR
jgi:hypothetical protein